MAHSYSLIQSHAFDLCAITHCTACLFSCVCAIISTGIYSSASYWIIDWPILSKEGTRKSYIDIISRNDLLFCFRFPLMFLNNEITVLRNTKALYQGEQMKCNFVARVDKYSTNSFLSLQIRSILALTHQRWIIPLRFCLECQRTFCLTNSIKLSWLKE